MPRKTRTESAPAKRCRKCGELIAAVRFAVDLGSPDGLGATHPGCPGSPVKSLAGLSDREAAAMYERCLAGPPRPGDAGPADIRDEIEIRVQEGGILRVGAFVYSWDAAGCRLRRRRQYSRKEPADQRPPSAPNRVYAMPRIGLPEPGVPAMDWQDEAEADVEVEAVA